MAGVNESRIAETSRSATAFSSPSGDEAAAGSLVAPLLLLALAAGIVLRLWSIGPTDLWEDEIIATTHATQGWWQVVADTLRYDIHPPLYFLQLHAWGLLSHSDRWFMANSMAWSLAGLFSLWHVTKEHYGPQTGLAATAFYAVLPAAAYMADQVRMYAMLAVLLIWTLHLTLQVFQRRERRKAVLAGLVGLNLALILTHALGGFAAGLYALLALRLCRRDGQALQYWLLCYGLSVLLALPWALNVLMHDGNIGGLWTLSAVAQLCAATIAGLPAEQNPVLLACGLAIFALVLVAGLRDPQSRPLLWHFVLLPLAVAILTGLFLKPFLKWNFFATLTAPYLALVLGMLLSRIGRPVAFLAALALCVLLALSVWQKASFRESSHFREVAQFLAPQYRPGDVVLVPQYGYFRGLAWYLDGPDWDVMAVAPPPSPAWRGVFSRLGPELVARLKLLPRGQLLADRNYVLVAGASSRFVHPDRIWLVTAPRADLPAGFPPVALDGMARQAEFHKGLDITLYASDRRGS
jgi:hypothetical protein